jgi:hypothetical protein
LGRGIEHEETQLLLHRGFRDQGQDSLTNAIR